MREVIPLYTQTIISANIFSAIVLYSIWTKIVKKGDMVERRGEYYRDNGFLWLSIAFLTWALSGILQLILPRLGVNADEPWN